MDHSEKNLAHPASDRRAEIISQATKVFLDQGFSGTSMAKLANAVGITKATFYHHFKSKDELFIACVISGYAQAIEALDALLEDSQLSDDQRLRRAIDVIYDTTVYSDVGRLSPVIAEVSRLMPELSQRFFDDYIAVQRRTLRQIVELGIKNGAFRAPDYDVLFHILFGPVVTLSLSREMFAGIPDLDAAFPTQKVQDGHTDLLLRYLKGNA